MKIPVDADRWKVESLDSETSFGACIAFLNGLSQI